MHDYIQQCVIEHVDGQLFGDCVESWRHELFGGDLECDYGDSGESDAVGINGDGDAEHADLQQQRSDLDVIVLRR